MASEIFDEKDNGASVQVRLDAEIAVELKENPTTGYRWITSSIAEAFLVPAGDEFVPPNEKTPGAGGLRRFFFRAKSEGSTTLTLINKRAWQSDDQAIDSFKLRIRIRT